MSHFRIKVCPWYLNIKFILLIRVHMLTKAPMHFWRVWKNHRHQLFLSLQPLKLRACQELPSFLVALCPFHSCRYKRCLWSMRKRICIGENISQWGDTQKMSQLYMQMGHFVMLLNYWVAIIQKQIKRKEFLSLLGTSSLKATLLWLFSRS